MKLEELTSEVLNLARNERALLAEQIMQSMDTESLSENDIEWLKVAKKRKQELEKDSSKLVSSGKVREVIAEVLAR